MRIKLEQIKPNFCKLTVNDKQFWLSYETVIAFSHNEYIACSENVWSVTTGKHLNEIEPDKSKRMNHEDFKKLLGVTKCPIH